MNLKMSEGTLVRDNIMRMIKLFNKIEILGAEINKETKVEMVLETLSDSF